MIAASSVETESVNKPFPQVLPKLCSTVMNSKTEGGRKINKNERKVVQNTLLSVIPRIKIFVKEVKRSLSLSLEQVF